MNSPIVPQSLESAPVALSLLCVPTDVLEYLIFKLLDTITLVLCSLVCKQFRRLSARRLTALPYNERHQNSILQEIFRNCWTHLSWFQAQLQYPSMSALSELRPILLDQCLCLAVEGYYFISIGILSLLFLISI